MKITLSNELCVDTSYIEFLKANLHRSIKNSCPWMPQG